MKFSKAILKGYERLGGKQAVGFFYLDGRGRIAGPDTAVRACVMGAALMAAGAEVRGPLDCQWRKQFVRAWGIDPADLNNNRSEDATPFPWEHIYGMAVAAGL